MESPESGLGPDIEFEPDPRLGLKRGPKSGPMEDCESTSSVHSKDLPMGFSARPRKTKERPGTGSGSEECESLCSDLSKDLPMGFSAGLIRTRSGSKLESESESGFGSCYDSMRSSHSKEPPSNPGLREVDPSSLSAQDQYRLHSIFKHLEKDVLRFVKQQLMSFFRLLTSKQTECTAERGEGHTVYSERTPEEEERSREAVLNITLDFLRRMDQEHLADLLLTCVPVRICKDKLKTHLRHRFSQVFEGVAKVGDSVPLQQIYTELFITESGPSELDQEHEVRHIESASWKIDQPETPLACEDIFKQQPTNKQQPIREQAKRKRPIKSRVKNLLHKLNPFKWTSNKFHESIQTELPDRHIRVVLTKGVAGVGKTVLTQKFSLDWAEGRANQDIQQLFPFTFRELNVLTKRNFSLVQLVHHFFTGTEELSSFEHFQVLFIFDGLDECRLPLDFSQTQVLTGPTESASVEELLVNLIRGSLLPSAHIWITTRPTAASRIPAEFVSMVTELQGFTDPQKEQYFRKRFRDEEQATAVISHIKTSQSLNIMCHLPGVCWILSNVLHLMETREKEELPATLTEMYIHFLMVPPTVNNVKYHEGTKTDFHWTPETREMVQSLGKLAFEQLQRGNLIFYQSDLTECGLDAADVAKYSRIFTQIFREVQGLYPDKVYYFIHLSVQEFLAALHIHQTFFGSGENLLSPSHSSESPAPEENLLSTPHSSESPAPEENLLSIPNPSVTPGSTTTNSSEQLPKKSIFQIFKREETTPTRKSTPSSESPEAFYRSAVDWALQSPNGHLDLLLRFLLGLSLPTNQRLLSGLLTETGSNRTNQDTVKYIKQKLNEGGVSVERSLNLLHCLNELNDRCMLEEMQQYMRDGNLSWYNRYMSPADWSALSFLLLSSNSDLEHFILSKYCPTEVGFLGLLPVIKASTKATLSGCGLSSLTCGPLASVLSSSSLTQLDLSNNNLRDSGVELLCEGLKNTLCRLDTLRLSGCLVSERGGTSLAAALSSTPSHLRELDLSYNHPGASVELLTALQAPQGPLQSLTLDPAGERWMVPGLRKYACDFTLDPNTVNSRLLLSEDNRSVTDVEEEQMYPDHRDRFTFWPQVLSSTGLRGRCYWEVEWSGDWSEWVVIAVSYRGIRRRGDGRECRFGNNDLSWSMGICDGDYAVCHRGRGTHVFTENLMSSSEESVSSDEVSSDEEGFSVGRVGVFLDWEGGALSFYEIFPDGEPLHFHTIFNTFTEPLFPGFGLYESNTRVSLVQINSPSTSVEQ